MFGVHVGTIKERGSRSELGLEFGLADVLHSRGTSEEFWLGLRSADVQRTSGNNEEVGVGVIGVTELVDVLHKCGSY